MSDWPHSRAKKVSWDAERARLKTASERLFSDSEVDDMVQDSERSLRNIRQSSDTLRRELESLAKKREVLRASQTKPAPKSPIEELSLEQEDPPTPPRRTASLSIDDYITSPDVLDFLHHYFPNSTEIAVDDFLSCIDLDYPDFAHIAGFHEAVVDRVTVDPQWVSLNRLQTLTQEIGLGAALDDIAQGLEAEIEEDQKQVNAVIVSEMAELNRILADKTKELDRREEELDALSKDHQIMRNRLIDSAQAEIEHMAEESLQSIRAQATTHLKRLQRLEKTLQDHLKSIRAKSEKAKPEVEKSQAEIGKLRARVQALEKMNDHLKGRNAALETELSGVKVQAQKSAEDLGKAKAKNTHLEQLVQDLKNQRAKEAQQPLPEPPVAPLPVPEVERTEKPGSAETALSLTVLGILLSGLKDILPLYISPMPQASLDHSPVSSLRSSVAVEDQWPGFGQLLYPTFNALVPKLVELLPTVVRLRASTAAGHTVTVLHALIAHTFTDHLREDSALQFPERIEFLPSTEFWRKKIASKGKTPDRGKPLYSLFANARVQKAAVAQLCKLLSDESWECPLQAAILVLMLSAVAKRQEDALRCIKSLVSEQKWKQQACDFLLMDPAHSLVVVMETVKAGKENVAALACQVVLLVSMHPGFARHAETIGRDANGFQVRCKQTLLESAKNVLSDADASDKSDLEEYLVVILQKLISSRLVTLRRRDPLAELLTRRMRALEKNASSSDVRFLLENISSILQHAG